MIKVYFLLVFSPVKLLLFHSFVLVLESRLKGKMLFGTSRLYDGGHIARKLAEIHMEPSAAALNQHKLPLPLPHWSVTSSLEKPKNMVKKKNSPLSILRTGWKDDTSFQKGQYMPGVIIHLPEVI